MEGPDLPEVPVALKSIQHYLKMASQHDERDPVVSYWARLYALQSGLKISTKTSMENNFLMKLMDWLEVTKKSLRDNEAITSEVVAQAHLENWALKLFLYADRSDRRGEFDKRVIQSFYTAGLLYDVLTLFGELGEEAAQNRKYAKWKAAYIHNCLKNGETPVPGPAISGRDTDEDDESNLDVDPEPAPRRSTPPADKDAYGFPSVPGSGTTPQAPSNSSYPNFPAPVTPNPYNPTPTPTSPSVPVAFSSISNSEGGSVTLSAEQMMKAAKYIKWAGSAINYDDVTTAVDNLQKALRLLTTGQDC